MGDERSGWDWGAFFLAPFWYISKGMKTKGIWLIVFCLFSALLAVPFVWVYCGARGKGDYYSFRLRQKSKINIDNL